MKLRYSAVAAALIGLLLPSISVAQPDERYWGTGMMWGGGLFHMFFGFLMMILFLAILVGVVVLLVRWLGSEHSLFRPTGQTSRTARRNDHSDVSFVADPHELPGVALAIRRGRDRDS